MKNIFSIEYHQILIQIEWDLFHCVLEEKSFHMSSSCFFLVLVEISSFVHGFVVVQPMFTKSDSLRNFEAYQDWNKSTSLTHMHIQTFGNISQLVNFKLSSCDLSPPLKPITGGSLKVRKMSYTHPNSISSVDMGSRRKEEEMRKDQIKYFSS